MLIPAGTVLAPLEPESGADQAPLPTRRRSPQKRVAGDRFRAVNDFVDVTLRSLTRTEGFVWMTLWRNTRHGLARASYNSLARTCGCRRATIATALRSLRDKGLVSIVRQGGKGRGPNIYRLRSVTDGT